MDNKLQIAFNKTHGDGGMVGTLVPLLVYEWTPKIRMHDNRRNYKDFVDYFLAPLYQEIKNTPMP